MVKGPRPRTSSGECLYKPGRKATTPLPSVVMKYTCLHWQQSMLNRPLDRKFSYSSFKMGGIRYNFNMESAELHIDMIVNAKLEANHS